MFCFYSRCLHTWERFSPDGIQIFPTTIVSLNAVGISESTQVQSYKKKTEFSSLKKLVRFGHITCIGYKTLVQPNSNMDEDLNIVIAFTTTFNFGSETVID